MSEIVSIGSICSLQNGRAFKPEEWSDAGTPIIRIQNLNDESKPFNYCSFEVEPRFHIKTGDLLFSWSGTPGTSFGAFFWNRGKGFLNQHIFRVDVDESRISKDYLRQALNAQLPFIMGQAHGGVGLQHITKGKLESVEIRLPSLHEQRRIAAILDQADALRAKRREALVQLDSLTQSIFIEIFGDPLSNPRGWPLHKLGTVGKLDRGVSKHRPRNAPELLEGPYPLIQTGDVANSDGYIRTYASTYSEFGLRQSKLWPAGTLCITIAANIAKTGILTFDACFPDSVVGFAAEHPATVEFVRVWLSFLQKMLEESAPESAQKNINLAILRDLDVPVPPLDLQTQFAAAIAAQRKLTEAHQAAAAELESLFASLQHRAFQGAL